MNRVAFHLMGKDGTSESFRGPSHYRSATKSLGYLAETLETKRLLGVHTLHTVYYRVI